MGKQRTLVKRAFGLILSLALVLGLIPWTGSNVYAANVAAVVMVDGSSGQTQWSTLSDAFANALENECTVTLLDDVTIPESETLTVGEEVNSFKLDLNGKELTIEGTLTSESESGAWVIVDSTEPGELTSSGTIDVAIQGFTADTYTISDGTVSGYFTIDGGTAVISGGEFTNGLMVENGGSANVDFTISGSPKIQGLELYATEGDYSLAIALEGGYYDSDPSIVDDNTAPYVKIVGEVQQYTGEMTDWEADSDTYSWRIKSETAEPLSIEDAEITIPKQTYTGRALQPVPTVVLNGATLTKGSDYTVTYNNNVNAGKGTAVITGVDPYTGSQEVPFVIDPMPISDCEAWTVPIYSKYTGKAVTPAVKLWNFGDYTQLEEGTDYTVTGYSNNTKVGEATATVTGKGNFKGTKSVSFQIIDMSKYAYLQPTINYVKVENIPLDSSGKVVKGEAKITVGFKVDPKVKEMEFYPTVTTGSKTAVIDYPRTTQRAESGSTPGSYEWTPSPADGDNCFTWSFTATTLGNEDTQTWSESSDGMVYSNGAKDGDLVGVYATGCEAVEFEGSEKSLWLESDPSNTISFKMVKDNKGKTFTAAEEKISISDATISAVADKTYTGSAIKPALTVKNGGKSLKLGTDYTVTWSNNVNVGTATATLTGKGNYKGTRKWTFKIVAKKVTPTITLSKYAYVYDGKQKTPTVTVKVDNKTMKKDTDYTVTYPSGRKEAGTYKISVKMKGNYTGSASKSFTINRGKQVIGGKTYFYDDKGVMKTGWVQIGNKWYYFSKTKATLGQMVTGWFQDGKTWYFFKADGTMASDEYCKGYYLNKNGSWTYKRKASWKKDSKGWWFGDGKWYAKNCKLTIDGKKYSFDARGYQK